MAKIKTDTYMHTILQTTLYMDSSMVIQYIDGSIATLTTAKYDYLYIDASVPQRDYAIYRPETTSYVNTTELNKIIADSSYLYSRAYRVKNSGI